MHAVATEVTGRGLEAASCSACALLPERAPPRKYVRSREIIAGLYRRSRIMRASFLSLDFVDPLPVSASMPDVPPAPFGTLMIQGTTSDAGKSTLGAGLCRLARRAGMRVAPFKPQNMALNSAVTVDGGEIGRAQALQAIAAGVAAEIDFNPVLLKPTSDRGAQVIIHGHAHANLDARAYHAYKTVA